MENAQSAVSPTRNKAMSEKKAIETGLFEALNTVSECLKRLKALPASDETKFLKKRLTNMQRFFGFIDKSVFSVLQVLRNKFE